MTSKNQKRLRNIVLVVIVVVFAGSLVIPAATQAHGNESPSAALAP